MSWLQRLRTTPLTYPDRYAWLVLVSTLDILLTYVVLYLGGREVNPVADWVIQRLDLWGMMAFKFALVLFFIVICEIIARHDHAKGRRVVLYGIALTCIPLISALLQLAMADME